MKPEIKAKLEKVCGFPFFKAVGEPLRGNVTSVNNWATAAKICRSQKWENCQLMSRNALQRRTEQKSWHRSEEWNALTDEIRPLLLSFVNRLLPRIPLRDKSLKNVIDAFSWDLMFVCLEEEYRDLVEPMFYIPHVEPWYAAGHFPCGWDGKEFPDDWDGIIREGKLMVF